MPKKKATKRAGRKSLKHSEAADRGSGGAPAPAAQDEQPATSASLADADDRLTRSDIRMVQSAVRKRWPTREEVKEAIANKVARIALTETNTRHVLMAGRLYAQFEAQNQADDLKQQPDQLDVNLTGGVMREEDQVAAVLAAVEAERARRRVPGLAREEAEAQDSAASNGGGRKRAKSSGQKKKRARKRSSNRKSG